MTNFQNSSFSTVRSEIEKICDLYRIAQIKLKNIDNRILNPSIGKTVVNKYRNYINTVELVLQCLNKEDASLIRNAVIRKMPAEELGYSVTTYYSKYRRAATSFLRYFL
ncbi:MAG: hypothetical protein LBF00_01240 [Mycoplasmataceae bacterium]|jgi:hypothetical protein|nr:hypothetical protein [Mycoplasmataceae bacterium]